MTELPRDGRALRAALFAVVLAAAGCQPSEMGTVGASKTDGPGSSAEGSLGAPGAGRNTGDEGATGGRGR